MRHVSHVKNINFCQLFLFKTVFNWVREAAKKSSFFNWTCPLRGGGGGGKGLSTKEKGTFLKLFFFAVEN